MATRAVSTVVTYRAWDTSANTPKTGDVGNHTLRWLKDGTSAAPAASPSEVDATNMPGRYKVTLSSTETDCVFGTLEGKSSTANIALFGVEIGFEYSAPAAFPTNFASLSISGAGLVSVTGDLSATMKASVATAALTTQMTEAYASVHTVPTLAQVLFEMRAMLTEKAVSSTLLTTKKIDGSTVAGTYTLDSATAPTAIERTS